MRLVLTSHLQRTSYLFGSQVNCCPCCTTRNFSRIAVLMFGQATMMKIAQIAPLIESVPPRFYGGTERIVSYLTEELVELGHDVTLFASGDSATSANLQACVPQALRLDERVSDVVPHHLLLLDRVWRVASQFDILHFHIDYLHFPLFRSLSERMLTTLHGRQDIDDLKPIYREFAEMKLVSISNNQRKPLPYANFVATIPHGLPLGLLKPTFAPRGGYLAFLGRITPEKGPDRAIGIARAARMPLKIAAKVDAVDLDYHRDHIEPLLTGSDVEFVGEIGEARKSQFLGNAAALLFPIDWPEPFGLVMIEAMACGTPVLAFKRGSVPEIIEDGVTGYVVDTIEEALEKLPLTLALDRRRIRAEFEHRFSARRMACDYVALYQSTLCDAAKSPQTLAIAQTPPTSPEEIPADIPLEAS